MAYAGNPDDPNAVIKRSREAVTGQDTPLRFPSEHGRYFTIIKFVTYNRTNPKVPAIKLDQADVVLPLPTNLREYYAIQYNDVEFDKLGGAVDAIDRVIGQYMSNGGDLMKSLEDAGAGAAGIELSQALARRTANFISDDLGGIIDRVQGNVVNPHITSVFRGVGLREHVLSWRLHPRSAKESADIRSIINLVRSKMHPTKKSDFLLNFPDEVYVKFYADSKPFLYPIFKAVVTSIDAPQSSDGTNAFYGKTDEPAFIDLTISIKEVEAVTRETFSEVDDGSANMIETQTDETGRSTL
jgi:hypothetical protein